jgi:hypothetical protein
MEPPGNLHRELSFGAVPLVPRTATAIIASNGEHVTMVHSAADAKVYVLDKPVNYGNSGAPVVLSESGRAIALCSLSQPVRVQQPDGAVIMIPSPYGVVTSIANIAAELSRL